MSEHLERGTMNAENALSAVTASVTLLAAIGLATAIGCNAKTERPAPPTYAVSGEVLAKDGRSLVGGCVEFKKEGEEELTATGVIDADGKFSLSIPYVDRVIPGATEGVHRAFVVMPLGANRKGGGYVPIVGEFKILPSQNHFTIELPSD